MASKSLKHLPFCRALDRLIPDLQTQILRLCFVPMSALQIQRPDNSDDNEAADIYKALEVLLSAPLLLETFWKDPQMLSSFRTYTPGRSIAPFDSTARVTMALLTHPNMQTDYRFVDKTSKWDDDATHGLYLSSPRKLSVYVSVMHEIYIMAVSILRLTETAPELCTVLFQSKMMPLAGLPKVDQHTILVYRLRRVLHSLKFFVTACDLHPRSMFLNLLDVLRGIIALKRRYGFADNEEPNGYEKALVIRFLQDLDQLPQSIKTQNADVNRIMSSDLTQKILFRAKTLNLATNTKYVNKDHRRFAYEFPRPLCDQHMWPEANWTGWKLHKSFCIHVLFRPLCEVTHQPKESCALRRLRASSYRAITAPAKKRQLTFNDFAAQGWRNIDTKYSQRPYSVSHMCAHPEGHCPYSRFSRPLFRPPVKYGGTEHDLESFRPALSGRSKLEVQMRDKEDSPVWLRVNLKPCSARLNDILIAEETQAWLSQTTLHWNGQKIKLPTADSQIPLIRYRRGKELGHLEVFFVSDHIFKFMNDEDMLESDMGSAPVSTELNFRLDWQRELEYETALMAV
ncbi:hypothetical protein BT63DRAFT_411951 [Microthyrium microscopicum]|uniref:Uncharacterized protein n=1 Tax=Microthyrium microscopicum TaxID=703497 RepID=A0A6A6UHF7_9PEZI|nr:hypothetical protein BT63DRAFT_411951 [Microthyrium microscopicum]